MGKKKKSLTDKAVDILWGLFLMFGVFACITWNIIKTQNATYFNDQLFMLITGCVISLILIVVIRIVEYNFRSPTNRNVNTKIEKGKNSLSSNDVEETAAVIKYRKMYNIPDENVVYCTSGTYSPYPVNATWHECEIAGKLIDSKVFSPYCIFLDTYLKTKSGKTVQIDIIAVGKRGIFVFESKDYSGWIFGNGGANQWTQTICRDKHHFYNPVKQNINHINILKSVINVNTKYHSLVVFGGNATLREISYIPKDSYVVTNYRLIEAIKDINSQPECLSAQEVLQICKLIHEKRLEPSDNIREGHIDQIKDSTGESRIYS